MVHPLPTLQQVEQQLRRTICRRCPLRGELVPRAGLRRTCDEGCSLFNGLPELRRRGEHLEPMVGHHEDAFLAWIQEMANAEEAAHPGRYSDPKLNPLRLHRRRAAAILGKMFNP